MSYKIPLSLLLIVSIVSGCSKDNNTDAPIPESPPQVSVQENEIVEEVELNNDEELDTAENSEVVANIEPDYNDSDVTDSALMEEVDEEQSRYNSVTGEPLYPEVDGPEVRVSQDEIDEMNKNAAN